MPHKPQQFLATISSPTAKLPQPNSHSQTPTAIHPHKNSHSQTPTVKLPQSNSHSQTPTQKLLQPNIHTRTPTAKHPHKNSHSQTPTSKLPQPNTHTGRVGSRCHTSRNSFWQLFHQLNSLHLLGNLGPIVSFRILSLSCTITFVLIKSDLHF